MCGKNPGNFQSGTKHFVPNLGLSQCNFLDLMHHWIGLTILSVPVMQVKSHLPDVCYYKNTEDAANEKLVAFGVRFLHS